MVTPMSLEKRYGLMKTFFHKDAFNALANLSREERLFVYYMHMAAVKCYPIALFQECPHPNLIRQFADFLEFLDHSTDFYSQMEIWWMFLFANYGVHFRRGTENNKKTPQMLGLNLITPASLASRGFKLTEQETRYLFDETWKPTSTIANDIENSGNHYYGPGMTSELYKDLDSNRKNIINAFHTVENDKVVTRVYSAKHDGVCSLTLQNALVWLRKACVLVEKSKSNAFDEHTLLSLKALIKYFESGDEQDFKEHSRHWLKMNNPCVEYTFGFIEVYNDPMGRIGEFQADVTCKSLNLDRLLQMLPSFEKRFPFPEEWKRKDMSNLPNAATAFKISGIGGCGPMVYIAAYCLPNYGDMRSELGSKQVMYAFPNFSDNTKTGIIYMDAKERKYDQKTHKLTYDLMVTLHETIGHASGSLLDGMTREKRKEMLGKWENALEEMRAEVIALFTGITFFDEIAKCGVLEDLPQKMQKSDILELFVQKIAGDGWKRWKTLPKGETKITQAHALADTGIMYFLIDHSDGAIKLVKETIEFQGKPLQVLRLRISDIERVIQTIGLLAKKVQQMSSTADQKMVEDFMNTYAASTRNKEFGTIVRKMNEICNDGVLAFVKIHPEWEPIYDEMGNIMDAQPKIPKDSTQACLDLFQFSKCQV